MTATKLFQENAHYFYIQQRKGHVIVLCAVFS